MPCFKKALLTEPLLTSLNGTYNRYR